MKTKKLGIFSMFIGALLMHSGLSNAFTVDTNSLNGSMTGLWNNANEPGWGATVTHQYNKIFATFYTYESNGTPVWYVASDCAVTADGCTGELYQVNGGTPLNSAWNGANKVVKSVGSIDFAFTSASTGAIGFTINGVSGSKSIEKSVFASAPVALVDLSSLQGSYSQGFYASFSGSSCSSYGVVSGNLYGSFSVTASGSVAVLTMDSCPMYLSYVSGNSTSGYNLSASVSCLGMSATGSLTAITKTNNQLNGNLVLNWPSCTQTVLF